MTNKVNLEFDWTHTEFRRGIDPDSPEKIGVRFLLFSINDERFECFQVDQEDHIESENVVDVYNECKKNPYIGMYNMDYAVRYLEKHEETELINRIKMSMLP